MARRFALPWLLTLVSGLSGCASVPGVRSFFGMDTPCVTGDCVKNAGYAVGPDKTPHNIAETKEPAPNEAVAEGLGRPNGIDERSKNNAKSQPTTGAVILDEPKGKELQLVAGPVDHGLRENGSQKQPANTLPEPPPLFSNVNDKKNGVPSVSGKIALAEAPQPMVEALRCVLADRPEEALSHLKGYDAETQDLLLRLLPTAGLFARKKVPDLTRDEAEKISQEFCAMQAIVRPRTELVITKACFCEWARAFGIYKPLSTDHGFLASTTQRPGELVQLYVELKNFFSDAKQGYHETCLSSTVQIRDSKGNEVWSYRFEDEKKPVRSLAPIHDYFNNYSFTMPPLPPGAYTLTLAVADQTRPDQRRIATKAIDFRISPLPSRGS